MAPLILFWLLHGLQSVVAGEENRYFRTPSEPPDNILNNQTTHAHGRSLLVCSPLHRIVNGICCHHSCKTCSSSTVCTECKEWHGTNNNDGSCWTPCYYDHGCGFCMSTDIPPLCQSCKANQVLDSVTNTCNCGNGYSLNNPSDTTACNKCTSGCKTCSSTACIECSFEDMEFHPTSVTYCKCKNSLKSLDGGICKDCPNGKYSNNDGFSCGSCYYEMAEYPGSSCKTCTSSLANACTSCYYSAKFDSATKTCIKCGNGFTQGADGISCIPCTVVGCKVCQYELAFQTCDTCLQDWVKKTNVLCEECPSGQYDNGMGSCNSCSISNCHRCAMSWTDYQIKCTTCLTGFLLSNGACPSCLDGYYGSSCSPCGIGCKTCSTLSACSACFTDMTSNGDGTCKCSAGSYPNGGVCNSCPSGQYSDGMTCSTCTSNCLVCSGTSTCSSCQNGWTVSGNICTQCLGATYWDGSLCQPCGTNCSVCTDDTICGTCLDVLMTNSAGNCQCPLDYKLVGSVCTLCPDSQFATNGITCSDCNQITCKRCTGSAAGQCSECIVKTGYILNGVCQASCLDGFKADEDGINCTACQDADCKTCSDSSAANKCIMCKKNFELSGGSCTSCTSGYYSTGDICKTCGDANCLECEGLNQCTKCADTYSVSNGICTQCPAGTYFDAVCKNCNIGCLVCPNASSCTTCNDQSMIRNSDGTCSCLTGSYRTSLGTCSLCKGLCSACSSETVCTSCFSYSELSGSTCKCPDNSKYDSITNLCPCNSGFTLMNNKCVTCKNYLSSSDISDAYFNDKFSLITIEFSVQIDSSLDPACTKTIDPSSLSKLGTSPICSWEGDKTLRISLGSGFAIRVENLILNGVYIVKKTGTCSTNYTPLSKAVRKTAEPVAIAILSGPSDFSLACGSGNLVYSAEMSTGSFQNGFTYVWSSTITPTNSVLSTSIASTISSSLSITRSSFNSNVDTTLTVSLSVTNVFGGSSSASITTIITGVPSLQVAIDVGTTAIIKTSDTREITASVSQLCGSSTNSVTYLWDYEENADSALIDSLAILASSNSNNKLLIDPNSLPAGNTYKFTVTATSTTQSGSSYSGKASITIKTESTPLVVKLSRSSGSISPSLDLKLDAGGSYDPDDPSGQLNYIWTCANSAASTQCKAKSGEALFTSESSSILSIPSAKLNPGSSYDIKITVSKDTRSASTTISLNVLNQDTQTTASITVDSKKVSPKYSLSLTAVVQTSSTSILKWTSISPPLTISPDYLSTINILANTLTSGATYNIQLSIKEISGTNYIITYPIIVNAGASCSGSAQISPSTGIPAKTIFTTSISGCIDTDGQDYPLKYTYDVLLNSKTSILGTSLKTSFASMFASGDNLVGVEVCDQLAGCIKKTRALKLSGTSGGIKRQDTTEIAALYADATLEKDSVPSTITIMCLEYNQISQEVFSQMWTDLQSYYNNLNSVDEDQFGLIVSAVQALAIQTNNTYISLYDDFKLFVITMLAENNIKADAQSETLWKLWTSLGSSYYNFTYEYAKVNQISHTPYVTKVNDMLTKFASYITKNDLPGQNTLPNIADSILKGYKEKRFAKDFLNQTLNFDEFNITFPTITDFGDMQVINIGVNQMKGQDQDFSDIFDFSFSDSGEYKDFLYTPKSEIQVAFSDQKNPITIRIPYKSLPANGLNCAYYNEDAEEWIEEDGCKIVSVEDGFIVVELYHFSMFKMVENSSDPIVTTTGSCDDNYVIIYVWAVVICVTAIGLLISKPVDAHSQKMKIPSVSPSVRAEIIESKENLVHKISGIEENSKDKMRDNFVTEEKLNENGSVKAVDDLIVKSLDETQKSTVKAIIKGHLLFGVLFYRKKFTRSLRIFTFSSIVLFQLLVEGLLITRFEDYDSSYDESSTDSLFDNYTQYYLTNFVFAALTISIPVEIFMQWSFSVNNSKVWTISTITLGLLFMVASIIGIAIISVDACHDWTGIWAVSFLWGILIEVFILETIYMFSRFLLLKTLKKSKKH